MHQLDRVMKMLAAKYPHIFMKLLFSDSPEVRFLAVEDTTINIPVLVLFSRQKDIKIIDEEKQLISQISDQQEQADLLALSAMVAYRKFKDILIKELFYKEYNMLKQSSFVQEWIEEGKKEGKKEGIRKGRIELLLAQLKRILGRVNSDLEERVHKLTDKELEKLSLDLLGIKQLSELEDWFRLHQKDQL